MIPSRFFIRYMRDNERNLISAPPKTEKRKLNVKTAFLTKLKDYHQDKGRKVKQNLWNFYQLLKQVNSCCTIFCSDNCSTNSPFFVLLRWLCCLGSSSGCASQEVSQKLFWEQAEQEKLSVSHCLLFLKATAYNDSTTLFNFCHCKIIGCHSEGSTMSALGIFLSRFDRCFFESKGVVQYCSM